MSAQAHLQEEALELREPHQMGQSAEAMPGAGLLLDKYTPSHQQLTPAELEAGKNKN